MKSKIISLALVIVFFISSLNYSNIFAQTPVFDEPNPPGSVFVVRVYYQHSDEIDQLSAFDVFEYNNREEQYVLVAVNQADYLRLQKMGFEVLVDPIETANFNRFSGINQVNSIPGYTCYRTVEETYQTAEAIVLAHPNLASWSDVGDSWGKSAGQADGYDMKVLKLTNAAIGGTKPRLFISASMHAREYTPAELVTRFAEYLIDNYDVNADATWLLDHYEIHLMMQANPDGRKEAEAGASWRKNTNENYCGVTSSNRGADLNRNFSYMWGSGGSSTIPCDTTYRGPGAASEPETQAMQNYIRAIFPDQRGTGAAPSDATGIYLDIHSAAGLVLWPWGYTSTNAPNATALQTLGRKFAYFNSYTPGQIVDTLYVASGSSVDFSYGELGVASYAFEIGTQFFETCSTFTNTILPANLQALIYAAKVARVPYLTPLGPDALNVAVSSAIVSIGDPVNLTATINDTRYRSGTNEATQNIAAAEYYLDTPPWSGGTPLAMAAADGSFNTKIEAVTTTLATSSLSAGRHILFVRGKDINNNWGAFSAVFLKIVDPTAVSINSFNVESEAGIVKLTWATDSEEASLGFNLYRAETLDGEKIKLNQQLIPSALPGSASGASYEFFDDNILPGIVHYYWLEHLDIYGASDFYGPQTAQIEMWRIYIPSVINYR